MNMKRIILSAFVAATLCAGNAYAQPAAVKKIIETAKTDNQTMRHLDILTNRFGGRLVGSAGFENSQAWIVKQLEDWGLEVTLEKAGEVPVGFNRGGWWGRAMGEYSETLYFTTPSYTAGTKGKQRGHVVIEPDELGKIRIAEAQESGKIAGSSPIYIVGPKGVVELDEGCIIANRHIHMSPADGAAFGVKDGDTVTVDVMGKRRTRWYDVQVRVHPDFRLEMHVDTDDANAVGIGNGCKVKVVKE